MKSKFVVPIRCIMLSRVNQRCFSNTSKITRATNTAVYMLIAKPKILAEADEIAGDDDVEN